ncbi:Endoplasmic reticulum-Golgi intermediate compartment protein 2 [Galemys pyrenaicus]|uniref:Endoplasmic reticulum-Golgi intermediate compartment protein n=1 Tax=Galemys pyrenaicus TaxID=202257 RepID=A0A8J6DQ56_GALPY|nr:Endoplasmic reticulum-Golgi intermediate compartment protein 2 [Galemys pyrenaicus]
MRRLNRKKTLNLVKELDAFPKVPDSYVETSASGGTVSLIAFTTMALLTIMEFSVYQDTWMKYEYEVDKDFSSKLRINIDITVAMKCQYVGADVLDLAETMVASADGLVYEPTLFDLSPQQKEWQRMLQVIQSRLQEEHSLQDFFVRLCGIIGGIFSTTGMLHGMGKFIVEIIYCRFRPGSYKPVNSVSFEDGHTDNHLPLLENNTH